MRAARGEEHREPMGGGGMMGGLGGGLGGLGGGLGGLGGGLGSIGGLLMGFGLMGLVPLLTLGVIIWLVVEATRSRGSQQTPPPPYGQAAPHNCGVQAPQAPHGGPEAVGHRE